MNSTIKELLEAVKLSPNNSPLRLLLAEAYLSNNDLVEAETAYKAAIQLNDSIKAKFGLATVYFKKPDYSTCNVILEELVQSKSENAEILLLYAKALYEEGMMSDAIGTYQKLQQRFPNDRDFSLEAQLKMGNAISQAEEAIQTSELIEQPNLSFSDVGGMEQVKKEIDLKIIQPLLHPEIYKAYGKKIGGGILMYGPPGCGKTYLAKATAGQVNANFINVSLSDILDMWIGNSEKNLHEVFELARASTPCVLFFDEIDALGASRNDMKQSAGRHLINQFLQELDGVEQDNEGILVLGATNTPWHLDAAFRRPGRFDRMVFVPPPDVAAREAIFKLKLDNKPKDKMNIAQLAKKSNEYSGADIEAVLDIAIEHKLEVALKTGKPEPLNTKDLEKAIKQHKPTTKEWFVAAKNFALYANDSGLYDDVLTYLKIKK